MYTLSYINLFLLRDVTILEESDPVYETPPSSYSAERILRILLDPTIDQEKVCKQKPTTVTKSSTYVVDITRLQHPDDIKKDSFGRWDHSGSHMMAFHTHLLDDGYVEIEKCAPGATGSTVYYLRRLHSTHPSNSACKRLIAVISGMHLV